MAGGLYDQDPDMLDKFQEIFHQIDEEERKEQKKREQESKRNNKSPSRSRGGRPARVTH
jgi:hypothetical protein